MQADADVLNPSDGPLRQWLAHQAGHGRRTWAVVDAAADASTRHLKQLDHMPGCHHMLSHRTQDAAALAVGPRLIELPDMPLGPLPPPLATLWQAQSADEPALFFLAAQGEAPGFVHAMRQRVRATLPDGDVMLLRWWDARIWWALASLPMAEHPDVVAFMGPVQASALLARDGGFQACAHAVPGPQSTLSDPPGCEVSPHTFARLLTLGEPDAVLGICRRDYPDALALVPPNSRHALACAQMAWATAQGFHSPEDHALAVRVAAELGEHWPEQAEWAHLVTQARAAGRTLRATLLAA